MALTINKKILPSIVANAHDAGLINAESSPTVAMYQMSRYWRELFQTSTRHRSDFMPKWSEREISAAKIITSALLFLSMEGCIDVEQLINDVVTLDHSETAGQIRYDNGKKKPNF